MPLKLFCALCDNEIKYKEDYFDVIISVKKFDGESTVNKDDKDSEYDNFCEDCMEKKNVSEYLYKILNKRNPDPDRIKKK